MKTLRLTPETSALVVIDVQEKLYAAIPDDLGRRAVRHVCWLLEAARRLEVPVFVTEQYPRGLGGTIGPVDAALAAFEPPPPRIEKVRFDACAADGFASALAQLREGPGGAARTAIVTGMEAHVCVYQTVRSLVEAGVPVHVPFDATCSRSPETLRIAEGLWREAGAVVTCAEAVLFDWLVEARGETFKAISRLLKGAAD